MKRIETDIWEPSPDNPQKLKYAGQRTAQEVFAELQHRLESTGYLPDEYFLMEDHWRNGREIPKGADIFCTTDFGASEGIYLNINLRWYDDEQKEPIIKGFITGKTLGESGADLDRMYLTASAVTKAFHSDGEHARYLRLGEQQDTGGAIMHLNAAEQRVLVDSLVEKRLWLTRDTDNVEQLLRRVTGSVIEFVNEVGERPMRISDYDKSVLAIQDGSPSVLFETHRNVPDKIGELLVQAAGRPGTVGREMTSMLLISAKDIPNDIYLSACKCAVATGDKERALMLVNDAERCVNGLDIKLYGEVIAQSLHDNKKHIAEALIEQCSLEQLKAADPKLMVQVLQKHDLPMALKLADSKIDVGECASEVIRSLTWNGNNRWYFKFLLERGMVIDSDNYSAMHTCLKTDNPEAAKLLIDRGMDFDAYSAWAEGQLDDVSDETFETVQEHWETEMKQQHEPSMGGM